MNFIVEDLQAALAQFAEIASDLKNRKQMKSRLKYLTFELRQRLEELGSNFKLLIVETTLAVI